MNPSMTLHALSPGMTEALFSAPLADALPQPEINHAKSFPLTMAGEGERVRIQSLQGGKGLAMRLTELGLNQGAEVRILQRQGGGLLVARGETRIALGGGMAARILVTVAAP